MSLAGRPCNSCSRTFKEEEEIDLMAVRAEREKLKAELAKLEDQMAVYLKELGYD